MNGDINKKTNRNKNLSMTGFKLASRILLNSEISVFPLHSMLLRKLLIISLYIYSTCLA